MVASTDRAAAADEARSGPDRAAAARTTLRIGGFTPLSTTDYPGELAAVVFCQGCPWRCGYCHNPHLLPSRAAYGIEWRDVAAFLDRRRGLLDAVVFSGGEPLAQPALSRAMRDAKAMGFRIGLHTGGAYPRRLRAVLALVDWVGFDVKAPFDSYERITRSAGSGAKAQESLELILASGTECEVRTTVHPLLLEASALKTLATRLAERGVRRYVLQAFRRKGCADRILVEGGAREAVPEDVEAAIAPLFDAFAVRRG